MNTCYTDTCCAVDDPIYCFVSVESASEVRQGFFPGRVYQGTRRVVASRDEQSGTNLSRDSHHTAAWSQPSSAVSARCPELDRCAIRGPDRNVTCDALFATANMFRSTSFCSPDMPFVLPTILWMRQPQQQPTGTCVSDRSHVVLRLFAATPHLL